MTGIRIVELGDPEVEFGQGNSATIKEGLVRYGPYSTRLGAAHPTTVRVGFVGTKASTDGAIAFFRRLTTKIPSGRPRPILAPDYPGFAEAFRSELALDPRWVSTIQDDDVDAALKLPPSEAFKVCLRLWADPVREFASRDIRPDVIVCAIPADVLAVCRVVKLPRREPRPRPSARKARAAKAGQLAFDFDLREYPPGSIEAESQPQPEDLLQRNFRRALKAAVMDAKFPIPTQIATPHLYEEGLKKQEDPATRAWNVSVAVFYKANGIPWRAAPEVQHTCFVGISFHHLYRTSSHVVFSSLAQAFPTEGDGFALRGEEIPWDEKDRIPHLDEAQAHLLLTRVADTYRNYTGRDPIRVVVHKTSEFNASEERGMRRALADIPTVELHTLRSGEFRLLRQGTYPPNRGTLCVFGTARFLFTTGYSPLRETYDGPHVPIPLEMVGADGHGDETAARELLGLTKMNWNAARDHMALPVSLAFARQVGLVMSEFPSGKGEPLPSYRFYM
jgi:hypothetical protein